MARFLSLVLLALLVVGEVAVVLALVDALGAAATLLLLALDVAAGFVVMRWGLRSQPPARGWRIGAGAFIALPGLVLDLVGLVLLAPAAQRWISGHVLRGTEAALRRRGVSVVTVRDRSGATRTTVVPGDVVAGDVVDGEATNRSQAHPAAPEAGPDPDSTTDRGGQQPHPGPEIVRGEILGPED